MEVGQQADSRGEARDESHGGKAVEHLRSRGPRQDQPQREYRHREDRRPETKGKRLLAVRRGVQHAKCQQGQQHELEGRDRDDRDGAREPRTTPPQK